jgi:hypothetical protein
MNGFGALVDGQDGAKAGLGAAILSGGNQVVIPRGTLMDFKLTQVLINNVVIPGRSVN